MRSRGGDGPWWTEWSAHTMLAALPRTGADLQLDQLRLVEHHRRPTRRRPVNSTASYTKISAFLCPSDFSRLTTPYGPNNYMANAGSAPNSPYGGNYGTPANGPSAGPFLWYANLQCYEMRSLVGRNNGQNFGVVTIASIIDGLSNTAAFSERVMGIGSPANNPFDPTIPGGNEVHVPPVTAAQETTPQAFYTVCKVTPPTPANGRRLGSATMTVWEEPCGVSAAGAQHSVHPRHAAEHLELHRQRVGAAESPTSPAAVIPAA